MTHTGQCLCGAVKLELEGDPIAARMCWCHDCQRLASGSATVNALFAPENVTVTGPITLHHKVADSGNTVAHPRKLNLILEVRFHLILMTRICSDRVPSFLSLSFCHFDHPHNINFMILLTIQSTPNTNMAMTPQTTKTMIVESRSSSPRGHVTFFISFTTSVKNAIIFSFMKDFPKNLFSSDCTSGGT